MTDVFDLSDYEPPTTAVISAHCTAKALWYCMYMVNFKRQVLNSNRFVGVIVMINNKN